MINNNININVNVKGFTLIEMVVALGIFMIFLAAVLSTFINLTTTQQKTNLNREAVSEVKNIVNLISTEAREKALDYNCYKEAACLPDETLALISPDGLERTLIEKECADDLCDLILKKQSRPESFSTWETPEQAQLNSENLKILSAQFFVVPKEDPFDIDSPYREQTQFQPVFHLVLNIARNSKEIGDSSPIIIQTSISSRLYNSL